MIQVPGRKSHGYDASGRGEGEGRQGGCIQVLLVGVRTIKARIELYGVMNTRRSLKFVHFVVEMMS